MREIKFRAWFNLKNKMVESENLAFQYEGDEENPLVFAFDKTDIDENGNEKGTMNFILMQYTGLKDKNGKEIYEGDIISTDLDRPFNIVVFRNGAFMFQCHDSGKDYYDYMFSVEEESDRWEYGEVIGNIYENPELLEETV